MPSLPPFGDSRRLLPEGTEPSRAPGVVTALGRCHRIALRALPSRITRLDFVAGPSNLRISPKAATRLVEAGAAISPEEPNPAARFLAIHQERLTDEMIMGNQEEGSEATPVPWKELGPMGDAHPDAPCWKGWRSQLQAAEQPRIRLGFYALVAPRLIPADGPWVLRAFAYAAQNHKADTPPYHALPYMLGTDWLLLYGLKGDWERFARGTPESWSLALKQLRDRLSHLKTQGPWTREGSILQDLQSGTPVPFSLWLGPSAESRGVKPPQVLSKPFYFPPYPEEAGYMHLTSNVRVRVRLDAKGAVLGLELQPGFGLAYFGPSTLSWAEGFKYLPAVQDEQPIPCETEISLRFWRPRN